MNSNDLLQIKESIARTTRFQVGYPKLITDVPEKWREFFKWSYDLCMARQEEIFAANTLSTDEARVNLELGL